MQAKYRMISSKSSVIYSFFFMIITFNLAIGFNFNRSESKVYSSLYRATNQDNTTNKSYKTFSDTNFNEISNTSEHFTNHTESTVNKADLQTEMTLLKRIRRRISPKNNACSHRNSHQDAHKLVDKCARKKTSRRNPKLHVHDSNRKNDTSKKQSDRKWEKQDGETSILLNGIKTKNLAKTASFEDNVKIPGSLTNNSYITKKRIGKVHVVNKVKLNNLPRNDILNDKSGIKDKNRQAFVGTDFSFVKGGKHSSIKKVTAVKHSHELSMNQVYRKNKQRTNMLSSVKRISNIQKRKKEKGHKNFSSDVKKLNTLIGETELHKNTLKNDDSLNLNNNRNRENAGEIPDRESFTSKSHGHLKMKENGLEHIKNSSESEILVKLKDVKDRLLKTHQKAKEDVGKKDYGNEKTAENSLKSMKVRRKARCLKNRRATLQQVKAHDALSRIQKHSHLKSLKRNTRNEMNIMYEMKDFIVNHFPKKRDEQEVESLQTRKNVHKEARNTVDDDSDNSSRMNRNGISSFKAENGISKTLEEINDFVVKNFHIERKKRNPLVEFNTLTNLGPNSLDNTKEQSSTIKNRNHTPSSSKLAIQHKKVNNLDKINNSYEIEYEFETDSNLQVSTETFVSNKVYRKPKDKKANLKSTQYIDESVDEDLDYPLKLIVLHLRNETAKAISTPTSLRAVSEESWINLPEKETKNSKLNNQGENEDEYEDSSDEISHVPPTESLETTPKPGILKELKNRLKEGEKLPNDKFDVYSKSNKFQMTTFPDAQPFDDERLSQTDKQLEETEIGMEDKETDKSVNEAISGQKLEENWTSKPTISQNEKLKSNLRNTGLTLNLKKQEEEEQEKTESTRKEVEKHVSSGNEMKPGEGKVHIENGTTGQEKFDYDEDEMNDAERSSYVDETIGYSTASDGLETFASEGTTMNDYDPGVSETESVTEIPEPLQKNAEFKTAGKDKECVRHLNSLISHLKEGRRNSHLKSMNHIISRRARAAVTSKPTPKPEVGQVRMPRAKEWWIGGAGIITMSLFITGM